MNAPSGITTLSFWSTAFRKIIRKIFGNALYHFVSIITMGGWLLGGSGCQVARRFHGYSTHPISQVASLVKEGMSMTEVVSCAGKPTITLPWDPNSWLYVHQETLRRGIAWPSLSSAHCILLTFKGQKLASIQQSQGFRHITSCPERTPLLHQIRRSFLERLVGPMLKNQDSDMMLPPM